MAKYRITSIPQYAPGGETNWPPDWMKRKKKKSNSETNFEYNYKPSTEESMVQGVYPQNMLGDVTSLYENVGREDYTKTTQEEVDSFYEPVSWKYGETTPAHDYTYNYRNPMRNPFTENSYVNSLEKKLGMSYSAYSGNPIEKKTIQIDEKFTPDYFAPFTETGKPLTCTGGKIAYKGQCITEEAFAIIRQRETEAEDLTYQQEQENKSNARKEIILKEQENNKRLEDEAWTKKVKDYYDKWENANAKNLKTKFIKPEPILKIPSTLTPEKQKELSKAYYLNKNKETGFIEVYPREIMNNRIMNNSYQISDFEKWGFDKKQLTAEWKPTIDLAHKVFTNTMNNKIITRALEQGKTVDQVISELGTNLGNQEGLIKDFKKPTEKVITDLFNSVQQNIINSIPSTDKDKVANGERIFRQSNDPVAAYNDAYHHNDFAWQLEQFTKQNDALSAYDKEKAEKDAKIKEAKDKPDVDLFGNTIYRDPFAYGDTNNEVRQESILRNDAINRNLEISKRTDVGYQAKNKEAIDALGLYYQNFGADILKANVEKKLNNIKGDSKAQIEFLKSFTDDTKKSVLTGENETLNNLFNDENTKELMNFAWSRNNFGRNDDAISEGIANKYNINDHPWDKFKDIAYNPIPAFEAWMNPRKTMYDNSGMSYTQKEKIKDETGVDMGTIGYDTPLGVLHYMYNAANPIKVGADVRQGYDNGHFWSSLGKSLTDAGMAIAPIKGFNALGNLSKSVRAANALKYAPKFLPNIRKGTSALLSGFDNPAFNIGFALQAPENFSNAGTNFNQGNYGTATWDALMGTAGAAPAFFAGANLLRYGQTPTKAFNLGVTTPKGKYYGFKQMPMRDLSYTTSNEALASELGINTKKDINALYKQFHPDAGIYSGQVGSNASANLANLTSVVPNKTSWIPGFNRAYPINIHSGKVGFVEEPTFISKNNYRFNFGQNEFKPLTAEEILLRPSPETYQFNPIVKPNPSSDIQFNPKLKFDTPRLGYKKGGSLPKAWNGLEVLKNAGKLINEFKAPTKNILMPALYQNIANSVYKNPNIQPILDMINPISNLDSQYLLTDQLSKIDDPYDALRDIYNQSASDFNIGDLSNFDRSTLNFATRRNAADALKNLGYVGNEVVAEDLFKMARTNDSMNKIMQLAIDQDRTGYRQVKGDFKPRGIILDGLGHSSFDMNRIKFGNPRSEVENMDLANVNRADPLSLAEYQATHVPMEQYGYRAGLPTMHRMDGMYLASLPEKQSYGPYQFKVKLPTDFSNGNWQDWYQKYIVNKKPLYESGYLNKSLLPEETYFNSGQSKGPAGESQRDSFNKTIGISNATGLNTRHWISGTGNKIGTIDPTFKFTDLRNMSAQERLDMENSRNSIINNFNTGWRGHYKKGGSLPKANIGRIVRSIKGLNIPIPIPKIPIRNLDKGMNINVNQLNPIVDYFKGVSEVPMVDLKNLSNTTGGNSLIQYGNEPFQGESFYHADPLDYQGIKDWKDQANIDANISLDKYLSDKPSYGKDTFEGVGDFNFAAGSDGWEVRNDLSNLATFGIEPSGPQWVPGKEDFFY
jgi:hypothetical protein